MLPVVQPIDNLNADSESIMLSNDTIELSLNPNEEDDEDSISLGVTSSECHQQDTQRITLQLSSNSSDCLSIGDVSINANTDINSSNNITTNKILKNLNVGQIFNDGTHFIGSTSKTPNQIDINVLTPRPRIFASSFSSCDSHTQASLSSNNLLGVKISSTHQTSKDFDRDTKRAPTPHIEASLDKLDEVRLFKITLKT